MSRFSGVRLWWRHRGWTAALAVQLVCLAWAVAGSGVRLQVPPLLSGAGVEVANAAVIPMVTAIAAGWALGRRDVELEASRRRPVRWWDVVVVGGLAASYLVTALLVPDRTLLVVACRNAAGLVGLSLLGLGLGLVRMGSALPVGYVVVSLFCGQMEMRKAVWSWPVKHAGARSPRSWRVPSSRRGLPSTCGARLGRGRPTRTCESGEAGLSIGRSPLRCPGPPRPAVA